MNYELDKRLKDAGFPQDECVFSWRDHSKYGRTVPEVQYTDEATGKFICAQPTLSDLIEACGDAFYGLERSEVYRTGGFGSDAPREYQGTSWFAKAGSIMAQAETPEEAVAKLWLALNQK